MKQAMVEEECASTRDCISIRCYSGVSTSIKRFDSGSELEEF